MQTETRSRRRTYVVDSPPWHALHALKRLYPTVLHLHEFPLFVLLGPIYEDPGSSAFIV